MAEREYQRLTKRAPRTAAGLVRIGWASLWLGKDHVLAIETTGYTENYKRFFFRDIQALLVRRTERWIAFAVVYGALAAIFGALVLVTLRAGEGVGAAVLGGVTAIWLLLLTLELVKGPTCICHLRTAVQTEELPSLSRVRQAHRVLERLRPLLAQAQGTLAPEELPARMQELVSGGAPRAVAPEPVRFVVDDPNAPPRMTS